MREGGVKAHSNLSKKKNKRSIEELWGHGQWHQSPAQGEQKDTASARGSKHKILDRKCTCFIRQFIVVDALSILKMAVSCLRKSRGEYDPKEKEQNQGKEARGRLVAAKTTTKETELNSQAERHLESCLIGGIMAFSMRNCKIEKKKTEGGLAMGDGCNSKEIRGLCC